MGAKHNAFGIAAVAIIVWGCASEPAPTAAQVDELEEEAWFPEPEDEDEEVPTRGPETAPPVVAAIGAIAPQPEAEPPTVAPQTDEPKPAPRPEKPKPAADRVPSKDEPAPKIDPEPPASDPIVVDPLPQPPTAVPSAAPKPSPPAEPKPAPVEPLNGEFRYGGGEAQKNRAAEAVEAVVNQMSLVSRGIARRRLLESTTPVRAVELRIDGSVVTAVFDGRRYQAKLGGAAVKVAGASGDPLDFKVRRRKDQLMLAFTGDRGGKTYVMRVDDKDRLRVRVTIHSSSLPDSVVYQLTYRRA